MTHRQALAVIVLLVVIALELAVIGVKVPTPQAAAQRGMDDLYSVTSDIRRAVESIGGAVDRISWGKCTNKKIC